MSNFARESSKSPSNVSLPDNVDKIICVFELPDSYFSYFDSCHVTISVNRVSEIIVINAELA